jgi:ABC-type phosphate transport system substrate-binding protein
MKGLHAALAALAAAVTLTVVAAAFALPAAANPPTAISWTFTFDDVNPCTGDMHTITIDGTTFVYEQDGSVVARSERTITTNPTGFVGHGTDTDVLNSQVEMVRTADLLTNSAGQRIMVRGVLVVDLSTGAVKVFKGDLTCLGPA